MDARTQTQLRKLTEQHAPHLTAALDELILQTPRLADGSIHDPREPVFHASTASDGYPPIEVEFDPSVGYHVIVFLDHLDTTRQICVPIAECDRSPMQCEPHPQASVSSCEISPSNKVEADNDRSRQHATNPAPNDRNRTPSR